MSVRDLMATFGIFGSLFMIVVTIVLVLIGVSMKLIKRTSDISWFKISLFYFAGGLLILSMTFYELLTPK